MFLLVLLGFGFIGVLRHINDISVTYVTAQMCRRTEEEVVPTAGLPTPDISYVL